MLARLLLALFLLLSSCSAQAHKLEPVDNGFARTPTGAEIHQDPSRLPLVVLIHPGARDWAPIIEQAVSEWNETLGFTAFLYVGPTEEEIPPIPGLVPVLIDGDKRDQANTLYAAHKETGVIASCFVVMPVGRMSTRVAILMAMHELGHVLGLDHDNDIPRSLMHPVLSAINVALTDHDVAIIRARYNLPDTLVVPTSTTSTSTLGIPAR